MDDSNPVIAIALVLLVTAPLWFGVASFLVGLLVGSSTGAIDDEATQFAIARLHASGAADRLLGDGWSVAPRGRLAEHNSDVGLQQLIVSRRVPLVGPLGRGSLTFQYRRDINGIAFEGTVAGAKGEEAI